MIGGSTFAVCKDERARDAAFEICMMAGACAGADFKNPHPANLPEQGVVIDRANKSRIRDGMLQEAADAWKVIFPSR